MNRITYHTPKGNNPLGFLVYYGARSGLNRAELLRGLPAQP